MILEMYPHAVIDITSNLLSTFSSKSTNESSEVLKMLDQKNIKWCDLLSFEETTDGTRGVARVLLKSDCQYFSYDSA